MNSVIWLHRNPLVSELKKFLDYGQEIVPVHGVSEFTHNSLV